VISSESSADSRVLGGKCECGTVQYSVADEFLYAANCHCSRCRAAIGSTCIRPMEHIFVGSKVPWFDITDDLPQFEEDGA
jgi:hypothetical protein